MTIKEFCDKAYQGGWRPPFQHANATTTEEWFGISQNVTMPKSQIMLSPEAWQAVEKSGAWKHEYDTKNPRKGTYSMMWLSNMHRLIDSLAEGKSVEDFLKTL